MGRYDGPHFEVENQQVVSVWVATTPWEQIPEDYWVVDWDGDDDDPWNAFASDFGFGSYEIDFVESYFDEDSKQPQPVSELLRPLSYSASFASHAETRAKELNVDRTCYVYLIYNFRYDPAVTGIEHSRWFRFLGAFAYEEDEAD